MAADLPPEQAGDETEFLARLGQFSEINSAERASVLATRTRAVRDQLAHYQAMHTLSAAHGHPWGALVTAVAGALGALALPAVRNTAVAR